MINTLLNTGLGLDRPNWPIPQTAKEANAACLMSRVIEYVISAGPNTTTAAHVSPELNAIFTNDRIYLIT